MKGSFTPVKPDEDGIGAGPGAGLGGGMNAEHLENLLIAVSNASDVPLVYSAPLVALGEALNVALKSAMMRMEIAGTGRAVGGG
jgi:hypothetical protein